ncbi:MAG: alpha/beta hydrolase [Firmicutes bacterium]|nr:alpha/beta hydrolase [Bacillota bacterium]
MIKILVPIILIFLVLFPFGMAVVVYEQNFGQRHETYLPLSRSLNEFPSLQRTRYTFTSQRGQELVGYKYCKEGPDPSGVVIIAHGLGGGGHNSYLDVADYLAGRGFLVFAYDATGNDESEGKSVRGLPQGLIDLDYAIRFVKDSPEFADLPIMLFGHSWGGYSTGSVLSLHPDVKAAVIVAGFNRPLDMIAEVGRKIAGSSINVLLPFLSFYEWLKFGSYARLSSLAGFESTNAGVMVIHSTNDNTVPMEVGYNLYLEKYADNPRFQFVEFKERGHNWVWHADSTRDYRAEFNDRFAAYLQTLDQEFTPEIRADYLEKHLDKGLLYALDEEIMDQIAGFYMQYTEVN